MVSFLHSVSCSTILYPLVRLIIVAFNPTKITLTVMSNDLEITQYLIMTVYSNNKVNGSYKSLLLKRQWWTGIEC